MESSVFKSFSHDDKEIVKMKKIFSDDWNKKILWVDDDPTSKILVQGMLKKEENEYINWASNGKEAIDMCGKKVYEIIFMDVRMPVMDGIETTEAIIKMNLDPPPVIIAITADATVDNLKKCKKVGMKDFFTKPFDYLKLAEILEKYI
jgi:CheY-like chemotaxis protein